MGNVYEAESDFETAQEYHLEALSILDRWGNRLEEARARWNLARALYGSRRTKQAIREASLARDYFTLVGHPARVEIAAAVEEWG